MFLFQEMADEKMKTNEDGMPFTFTFGWLYTKHENGERNNKKQKLETFFYKRKKGQRLKIDRLAAARN